MSSHLKPTKIITIKLPKKQGKKTVKVEMFPVEMFQRKWKPYKSNFYPKPPIHDYKWWWASGLYRLRIDGKWNCMEAKYTFYDLYSVNQMILMEISQ